MIRTKIIKGDVLAEQESVLLSARFIEPANIESILIPAQPEGPGFIECKFGITVAKHGEELSEGNTQDITWMVCGGDKLYLPQKALVIKPAQIDRYFGWRLVLYLKSSMKTQHTLTFEAELEQ